MSDDTQPTALIHKAIAAIMGDVTHISKDQTNTQQRFKFRGIEDVMNSLHQVFKKHEVVIFTEILAHEMNEFKTKSGGTGYHHLSRVAFHLTASDGSRNTIVSLGEAMDYGDKGATKTLSIALKYALLNLFLIPTAETAADDADATTHEVAAKPPMTQAEAIEMLGQSVDLAALTGDYNRLPAEMKANADVIAYCKTRKAEFAPTEAAK